MCLPQFDTLTETGQEKQMGHTISELWYFGYPVPQLCLTRRPFSFFRVVEDAGFVTLSSLSSFPLSASGAVSITRHKKDRNENSDERVTNWTSDTSRKRTKSFLLPAQCTGTPMYDPHDQNNGKLLNKQGGGVVFGPDKSNRKRCSLCRFRLRWRKAAVTLT